MRCLSVFVEGGIDVIGVAVSYGNDYARWSILYW